MTKNSNLVPAILCFSFGIGIFSFIGCKTEKTLSDEPISKIDQNRDKGLSLVTIEDYSIDEEGKYVLQKKGEDIKFTPTSNGLPETSLDKLSDTFVAELKKWNISKAIMTPNGKLIDMETQKLIQQGCFSFAVENITGLWLIDKNRDYIDNFLDQSRTHMLIVAAGHICTNQNGHLTRFDNKSKYAFADITNGNMLRILESYGLIVDRISHFQLSGGLSSFLNNLFSSSKPKVKTDSYIPMRGVKGAKRKIFDPMPNPLNKPEIDMLNKKRVDLKDASKQGAEVSKPKRKIFDPMPNPLNKPEIDLINKQIDEILVKKKPEITLISTNSKTSQKHPLFEAAIRKQNISTKLTQPNIFPKKFLEDSPLFTISSFTNKAPEKEMLGIVTGTTRPKMVSAETQTTDQLYLPLKNEDIPQAANLNDLLKKQGARGNIPKPPNLITLLKNQEQVATKSTTKKIPDNNSTTGKSVVQQHGVNPALLREQTNKLKKPSPIFEPIKEKSVDEQALEILKDDKLSYEDKVKKFNELSQGKTLSHQEMLALAIHRRNLEINKYNGLDKSSDWSDSDWFDSD